MVELWTDETVSTGWLWRGESKELAAVESRFGSAPFFLYVGALAPHKNLTGIARAFARFRRHTGADSTRLIIAGNPFGRYRESELVPLIRQLGLTQRVVLAGFVDDLLLRELYRRALALLLPSFAEGFGLWHRLNFPECRAPALGRPVFPAGFADRGPRVLGLRLY